MAEATNREKRCLSFGAGLGIFGQIVDRYATEAYGLTYRVIFIGSSLEWLHA